MHAGVGDPVRLPAFPHAACPMEREAWSRRVRISCIRHTSTRVSASRMMSRDILDSPTVRSVTMMGTSTTRSPSRSAAQAFSIWKQYPFNDESETWIRRRAEAWNALKPDVTSRVDRARISRTYRCRP